jgi:hypothetical protein
MNWVYSGGGPPAGLKCCGGETGERGSSLPAWTE